MSKKPYAIRNNITGQTLLVNASNKSQAVRVLADDVFDAQIASGAEVAALMKQGVELIESGEAGAQDELPEVE